MAKHKHEWAVVARWGNGAERRRCACGSESVLAPYVRCPGCGKPFRSWRGEGASGCRACMRELRERERAAELSPIVERLRREQAAAWERNWPRFLAELEWRRERRRQGLGFDTRPMQTGHRSAID